MGKPLFQRETPLQRYLIPFVPSRVCGTDSGLQLARATIS